MQIKGVAMPKHQRGITLIEALVALAILGFGLLGATKMQMNLTANAQVARQRAEAVQLAKSKIELMRSTNICAAESGSTYTPPQGSAIFTFNVTCDGSSPTVVVSWNDAKGGQAKAKDDTADNRVVLTTTLNQ